MAQEDARSPESGEENLPAPSRPKPQETALQSDATALAEKQRAKDAERGLDPDCPSGNALRPWGHYRSAESRAVAMANLCEPWRPGQPRPPGAGRKKGRTFAEDAREILDGGVPPKLRETVAKKTGLPLHQIDKASLRQVIVISLIHDYLAKGKLDALAQLLERTDPKSRRVEVEGRVDHNHAVVEKLVAGTESEVQEAYKSILEGGVIDAEVVG